MNPYDIRNTKPLNPEVEDTFFLKVVEAKLVFGRDDSGKVIDVALHQAGQEMKGLKKWSR